jgi:hypothetical protein
MMIFNPPGEGPPSMIRLIVTSYRKLGFRLEPGQREWWRVEREDDGSVVLERSPQPFFAGARALLALGVDPETLVTMRHAGEIHDSFIPITVRAAAAMMVSDGDFGSLEIRKWTEHPEKARRDLAKAHSRGVDGFAGITRAADEVGPVARDADEE